MRARNVMPKEEGHMAEHTSSLESTITKLTEQKKYAALRDILVTMNPADTAALFDHLDQHLLPLLFRLLPKDEAADTFVEMDPESQQLLIQGFSDSELKDVIDELYVDDAVDLVEEMPANVVRRILRQADPETRKLINNILQYPEDSAGSLMTTEFVDLKPDMSVSAAVKRIKRTGTDKETINICYVIDNSRRLLGTVSIRTLILAEEDTIVSDIMTENVISVGTLADQEDVTAFFSKYDLTVLPVVDNENRLVGIITVDDALDVMETETTEDIEIMGGITPTDKPYLRTSVWETFKSRFPWLFLLMISATFTGQIITRFENALASATVLTAYIPMLMDTGGNSGSQASVTVIRGISLKNITFSDFFRVVWKEIRVAVLCGTALAIVNFAKLLLVDGLLFHNENITFSVAAVICLTMMCTILCAKVVGCTLPLLADKVGFDPAVMSSPFITTIVDALSLLIYFRFAVLILHV